MALFAMGGIEAAAESPAGAAFAEAEAAAEASCFRPGTLVLTAKGLRPIETIALGQRILPFPDDLTPPSSINPFDYRQIHLQIAKDGKLFDMRFLRPARLFEGLGAGDLMNLHALELELEGRATVLSIDPCPPIEEGPGNVVTGAFSGQTVNLKRLKLKGAEEPIETTGNHPFFSEDQLAFITVNHLHPGERLRTRAGVTEIEWIREFPGRWDVFNLEIDGAHQYYVTDQCVLVHNGNAVLGGPGEEDLSLTDARARQHILDGDGPGSGGHGPGRGISGKSEFPSTWSDQRVLNEISDIVSDPNQVWSLPNARGYVTTTKNVGGVDVKVVFDTRNGRIVTGYPTNLPRNP
jgi:hypothetical protein